MISFAKQDGGVVFVYDENNHILFSRAGELAGYTSTTVSFKINNNMIQVYDEKGNYKFTR